MKNSFARLWALSFLSFAGCEAQGLLAVELNTDFDLKGVSRGGGTTLATGDFGAAFLRTKDSFVDTSTDAGLAPRRPTFSAALVHASVPYVATERGLILSYQDDLWTIEETPLREALTVLVSATPSQIYAFGRGKSYLIKQGSAGNWRRLALPIGEDERVTAAWLMGDANGVLVTQKGRVLERQEDSSWSVLAVNTATVATGTTSASGAFPLYATWSSTISAPRYIAGAGGTIYSKAGPTAKWVPEESGTQVDIYALAGNKEGIVYAVGAQGVLLKRDELGWQSISSGTASDLYDVEYVAEDDSLLIAGARGLLLEGPAP